VDEMEFGFHQGQEISLCSQHADWLWDCPAFYWMGTM